MKIIRHLNNIEKPEKPLALTIGNFDGVHLGHREIITKVKNFAKEKKLSSAILTFEPHPFFLFNQDKASNFRISTLSQKLKIFREYEIDYVIVLPFNYKTAAISATDFIEKILVETFNVKHLTVGYDFTFGKNRQGNFALLQQSQQKFGFELTKVEEFLLATKTCSSSLIRNLISAGEIKQANQILGHNFSIAGIVIHGRKLANQLGFATANLKAKGHIIKPKFGVYRTITFIPELQKKFPSITNFGIKPTLGGDLEPLFETHLLNFNQQIYGKKIEVEFVDFIREEKKFSSIDELKEQITKDVLHVF